MKRGMLALAVVFLLASTCAARELVVTSTANSGQGTLRWALQNAMTGDTVIFDPSVFPPSDPATIYPSSELPSLGLLQSGVTVDASNAGVVIDGSAIRSDWSVGLRVNGASNCRIMGLQIVGFSGVGIAVFGASHTVIGGLRDRGKGPVGQGNLLGSGTFGIELGGGTSDTTIRGNIIGADLTLENPLGSRTGVEVYHGAVNTAIGPGNVIAYNQLDVSLDGKRVHGTAFFENLLIRDALTRIALQGGANAGVTAPFIDYLDALEGVVRGNACPGCSVEVYSFSEDGLGRTEGITISGEDGQFELDKGSSLRGTSVVAAATDEAGNTGPFSNVFPWHEMTRIQHGSLPAPSELVTKPSGELDDSRIGLFTCALLHPDYEPEVFPDFGVLDTQYILDLGVKRVRLSISNFDPPKIDWGVSEFVIEPEHDAFIDELIGNGISITFNLVFWDKDYAADGGNVRSPRFRTDAEVERYLEYVRFIVRHFKGRVEYYELWNEPTVLNTIMEIELHDYLKLARRAIPIIKEEDPRAKVVVGSISHAIDSHAQEFLRGVLRSDIMKTADGVAWHPMYGTSPASDYHREYYYGYAELVREFRRIATDYGFDGAFKGDELNWLTPDQAYNDWPNEYTEPVCAKYFARGILTHLGLVDSTSVILLLDRPAIYGTIQNLCTAMAGNESVDMPIEIGTECSGPVAYCAFRYPNGDRLLAIWTDGVAEDEDPGIPATITFPSLAAGSVTGIDVLHGFEQELIFEIDGEDTIIRSFLVKDYPILIRLSDVTFGPTYEETVGDGFHRLGDPSAAPTGSGADRDGDGVPDDEDLCPDWPGSEATSGC